MPILLRLAALALALVLPAAAAQSADAVTASLPRVLADGTQTLKGDDGQPTTLRATLVYDPVAGEYVRTVTDAGGAVLRRDVRTTAMVRPTEAEEATAQALIRSDAEVAAGIAAAQHEVVVAGGFPLVREAGHACGPGSRCLMYDVYEVVPGQRAAERIRFVVVDLRSVSLWSNDFDASAEGNLAHPDAARSGATSR